MTDSTNDYRIQFENFSDSELEKVMRKLDVRQMGEFLDALESYNKERAEELTYLKDENDRLKSVCGYYLKELWCCVPEAERSSTASFFKEQMDDTMSL